MDKKLLYEGKNIFYRIIGSGKPVVLTHGFGEDGEIWKAPSNSPNGGEVYSQSSLFENSLLISKFKFIIPDLPGSGKSEMINDMSIEGMAEVIKSIVEVVFRSSPVGGGQVGAIGHSMGGYITLAFAEKYPEYLNAFGLFHSSAYADSEEKKQTRKKGIEFIKQHGAFEFLKTVVPNLFSPESKEKIPEKINDFIKSLHNFSPDALVSYYEAMMQRPDRTDVLKKSKIPVLFIMGKYDTAIPLEDGLKQCHLPEKSYIHILHKSGHMGMIEEAEESTRFLEEFLMQT